MCDVGSSTQRQVLALSTKEGYRFYLRLWINASDSKPLLPPSGGARLVDEPGLSQRQTLVPSVPEDRLLEVPE
jgi:hypothetical protein